jgi:hypothetical protein
LDAGCPFAKKIFCQFYFNQQFSLFVNLNFQF